jgi:hypothetical protein
MEADNQLRSIVSRIDRELQTAGVYHETATMQFYQSTVDLWVEGCLSNGSIPPANLPAPTLLAASLGNYWITANRFIIENHPDHGHWAALAQKYERVYSRLGQRVAV